MKKINGKRALLVLLLTTFYFLLSTSCFSQVDPEVYFNSGIDKYVKGDYDGAVELFENTLTENPQHQKAKGFLLKVLVEATEKQIMMSNYQKAKIYIEKAKVISPEDPKVNELQKIIVGGPGKRKVESVSEQKSNVVKEPVPDAAPKIIRVKPAEKKVEIPKVIENFETSDFDEQPAENTKKYILISGSILVAGGVLFLIFYFWMKERRKENLKKLEELKSKIHIEEENKFKQELEKIRKSEEEKLKKGIAEGRKLQIAEKKNISEKDGEVARRQFEATIEEVKILDTITDDLKKEDYSKQIIQKMTTAIKTIMNENKDAALENLIRLSKSDQSRLRYDCVKIIENILTVDTFKILLELLNDSDYEVKKSAITVANNICKLHPAEIPFDIISKAQKQITEEKIRNGWII